MSDFIDRTNEYSAYAQEIMDDLKTTFPDLYPDNLDIPFKKYHLFRDYRETKLLESAKIERANSAVHVIFVEVHYAIPLQRDGSASQSDLTEYVVVQMPVDFGHIYIKQKTFADKVRELLSPTELKVPDDAEFNRRFLLLAKEKNKALPLFSNAFRSILKSSKLPELHLELVDQKMILSNQKYTDEFDLEDLVQLGLDIAAAR